MSTVAGVDAAAALGPDSLPAQAQRDPQQVGERVVVSARPLDSVAASVEIIDEEQILASNARSVAEVLEYVAGARVLSAAARGGLTTIQLRGGDPNFVLVLIDGVPLNDPTDVEGGSVNLSTLPLSGVERIEVARGPLSYFYGSTALSGIVNIVTRGGSTDSPRLRGSVEGGAGALFRGDVSVSGRARDIDYFVGFDGERQRQMLGDDDFRLANLQGKLTLPVGSSATLGVVSRFASSRTDDYPEASGGPVYGSGMLRHSETTEVGIGGDLGWTLNSGWRNRFVASYYGRDMDRDSPAVPPQVPPSVEDTSYHHLRGGLLSTWDVSPELSVSGGVDVDHEDGTNVSTLFLPAFFGGPVAADYRLSRTTPGVFVEATARRGRVALEAGIRADFPEEDPAAWSPRVGMSYTFGETGTVVRGTASRAFKLPSFFALASPPEIGGNPELRPETSVGFDVGVEQRLADDRARLSVTLFWSRYEDLIDFDFDLFRNVNRDEVRAKGVEIGGRWEPDARIALRVGLAYQSTENADPFVPVRNLPEWSGSVRLRLRPATRVRLGVETSFATESFDVQLPVADENLVEGYAVVDLTATFDVGGPWQVLGRLDNVTDTDYEHYIGFPQPGITAYLGLRYGLR